MKRMALVAVVVVALCGTGAVLAAPSGVNRVVAKGLTGNVSIEAKGPVQVTHGVASVDSGGTTDWISWPGDLLTRPLEAEGRRYLPFSWLGGRMEAGAGGASPSLLCRGNAARDPVSKGVRPFLEREPVGWAVAD
jgi:hypothetical protein